MRISDWSSDVCSSDLVDLQHGRAHFFRRHAVLADVAHEIKNPLSSLRSAVETVARVEDPDQQKKLMSIILDDVQRLDRLISDISDASRLDAELSRAETDPVRSEERRVGKECVRQCRSRWSP